MGARQHPLPLSVGASRPTAARTLPLPLAPVPGCCPTSPQTSEGGGGCHCRAATRREPPGGRPRATCTGLTRAAGSVSVRNPPRSTYASKHVLGTSPPLLAPYYFPSNCSGHYIFLITAGISRADTIFLGTRRDDGKTCIRLSGSSLCPSRSHNAMLTRIFIDFVMSRTSHI